MATYNRPIPKWATQTAQAEAFIGPQQTWQQQPTPATVPVMRAQSKSFIGPLRGNETDEWWKSLPTARPLTPAVSAPAQAYGAVAPYAVTRPKPVATAPLNWDQILAQIQAGPEPPPTPGVSAQQMGPQLPNDVVVQPGKYPTTQEIAAPGAQPDAWQAPSWFPPADTIAGQIFRDVARPWVSGKPGESLMASSIPDMWANIGQQQGVGNQLGALVGALTGTLGAAMTPLMPKAAMPLLNATSQGLEAGIGTLSTNIPRYSGTLGNALWRFASLPGLIKTLNDPKVAFNETMADIWQTKEGKAPFFELKASPVAQVYQDVADFQRFYGGEDFGKKYRERNRGPLGVNLEANPLDNSPAGYIAGMLKNIAASGPDAQRNASFRMAAGEDQDVVLRGYGLPATPTADEIAMFNTRVDEYILSQERLARYHASKAGGTPKEVIDAGIQARDAAEMQINSKGFIPGEESPAAEMILQTVVGFSPLDPMNKIPLGKVFGFEPLKKVPVLGKFVRAGERVVGAVQRRLPEQQAVDDTVRFNSKFDESMRGALNAEVKGPTVAWEKRGEALQQKAAGGNIAYRALSSVYDFTTKALDHTPETKARIYEGHTLDTINTLVKDATTPGEVMDTLTRLTNSPNELTARFGKVPTSVKAELARPIVKAILPDIEKLPSMKEADFNPVKFLSEAMPVFRKASRELAGVPAKRTGLPSIVYGVKGWMAEFYLRTLGYIARNGVNNYGTLLVDGLLTRDSFDAWTSYLARAGVKPGEVGKKVPVSYLDKAGIPVDMAAREGGMYEHGGKSKFTKVPVVGAIQNTIGDFSNAMENNGRIGAFTAAMRQFVNKNWYPKLSDDVRTYFGDAHADIMDYVESRVRAAVNPKEIQAAVNDALNAKHPAGTFAITKVLDDADLIDALSPETLAQVQKTMQDHAQNGVSDNPNPSSTCLWCWRMKSVVYFSCAILDTEGSIWVPPTKTIRSSIGCWPS